MSESDVNEQVAMPDADHKAPDVEEPAVHEHGAAGVTRQEMERHLDNRCSGKRHVFNQKDHFGIGMSMNEREPVPRSPSPGLKEAHQDHEAAVGPPKDEQSQTDSAPTAASKPEPALGPRIRHLCRPKDTLQIGAGGMFGDSGFGDDEKRI